MDIKIDKLKYQKNKIGYNFMLLAIIFSIIALFKMINYHSYSGTEGEMKVIPDIMLAAEIMIGILMILGLFLTAEFMKYYQIRASYFAMVIGSINIIRIFFKPMQLLNNHQIPTKVFVSIVIYFSLTFISVLVASSITLLKGYQLKKLLESEE